MIVSLITMLGLYFTLSTVLRVFLAVDVAASFTPELIAATVAGFITPVIIWVLKRLGGTPDSNVISGKIAVFLTGFVSLIFGALTNWIASQFGSGPGGGAEGDPNAGPGIFGAGGIVFLVSQLVYWVTKGRKTNSDTPVDPLARSSRDPGNIG